MEVVEEGEGSTGPAKRKEEGRRDPSTTSAPTISIVIGSCVAFFLRRPSTSRHPEQAQAGALLGHALSAVWFSGRAPWHKAAAANHSLWQPFYGSGAAAADTQKL